jgi:Tol biopolymer transport system component
VNRRDAVMVSLLAWGCDAPVPASDGEPSSTPMIATSALVEMGAAVREGLPPASGGALLFHSDRGGRNHVYRLDLATGAIVAVTDGTSYHDEDPAPSPDGRRVAFSTTRFDQRTFDIAVMNHDGTAVQRVTSDLAFERHPVWAADSRHLFFTGEDEGTQTLYRLAIDGGALTRLSPPPDRALMPAPSPDGRRLAYVVGTVAGLRAVVQDLSTGARHEVTPEAQNVAEPAWSHDGARLAYARFEPGGSTIEAVTLATGAVTRWRVPGFSTLREPAWSSDGRWLAATGSAASGRDEDWDLVLLPSGGGAAYRVTSGVAHDRAPSWLGR